MRRSFSLIEILIELFLMSFLIVVLFAIYMLCLKNLLYVMKDSDSFVDMCMAVTFLRDETLTRLVEIGYTVESSNLSYTGFSDGEEKKITYSVELEGEEYRIYRTAAGEGKNIVYRSKNPIFFEKKKGFVLIHLEGYEFVLYEPRDFKHLEDFPGVDRYKTDHRLK